MTDIQTLDAEIVDLQRQATAIEAAPRHFDEEWLTVERALLDAEAAFKTHGPLLDATPAVFPETAQRRHQVSVGAAMVANGKALLDSERVRVKAMTDGGIAVADKHQRLADLKRAILRTAARRAKLVRSTGEFLPRSAVHPELVIATGAELEQLAR